MSEEDPGSPECLTSEPVRDPYSTDEELDIGKKEYENRQEEKKKKRKCKNTQKAVNFTHKTVSIDTIVNAFKICLLKLPKCDIKFEQIISLGVNQILDLFLPMVFGKISTKEVVDAGEDVEILNILYDLKSYIIPADYDDNMSCKRAKNFIKLLRRDLEWLRDDMRRLAVQISRTREETISKLSHQHDKFKSLFGHFVQLLHEGVAHRGSCRYTFELPKITTYQYNNDDEPSEVFTQPDLVIGHDRLKAKVPVEIYSPHKLEEEEDPAVFSPDSSDPRSSSDDCEDSVSLNSFLRSNMPFFMGAKRCEGMLKEKLTKELLLQLLGTSRDNITNVITTQVRKINKEKRVFIGLLVCHFYVYILKMEAYEYDLFVYINANVENADLVEGAREALDIQFVPLPLDIRLPSHGIALLYMLEYYIRSYMS